MPTIARKRKPRAQRLPQNGKGLFKGIASLGGVLGSLMYNTPSLIGRTARYAMNTGDAFLRRTKLASRALMPLARMSPNTFTPLWFNTALRGYGKKRRVRRRRR